MSAAICRATELFVVDPELGAVVDPEPGGFELPAGFGTVTLETAEEDHELYRATTFIA